MQCSFRSRLGILTSASRDREIDALLIAGSDGAETVSSLNVNGRPLAQGIDLNGASEDGVAVSAIVEAGEELRSTDLFFSAVLPDPQLRAYVRFVLERKLEQEPDALLARADVLDIFVPANLDAVAAAIDALATDGLERYDSALIALDKVVADQCGIPQALRDHMIKAMTTDPLLSKMRPMIAQRGLRIQPYADHSEGDRYA